jgi:hypothetical protein
MPMTPGGSGTPASTFQPWDRDALVRFIDVDVKPGKTYRYAVRVRLANPNFERPVKELAWAGLGANKDLDPSEWTQTPEISIPEEYFLYAVDQNLLDDWDKGKTPDKNAVYKPETATSFQIHEWVPQRMDNKFAGGGVGIAGMRIIGDWVIAERQQVKRGDPIGKDLTVQTPVWDQRKDAFTIPQDRAREDKKKGVSQKGAHLDLVKGGRPAHLVDFVGGRRLNAFNKLEEDVAVDALILMPDGKLKVLNSRDASEFKDRQDRIIEMRKRIDDINANGNPNMPKGPGPGPGPGLPKKGLGGTSGS